MKNWDTQKGCALGNAVCSQSCRWYRQSVGAEDNHLICGLLYELRLIGRALKGEK